jgi:hypothetical protein
MALANWEFTRWGMTVNEVERASHYTAIKNGQGQGRRRAFSYGVFLQTKPDGRACEPASVVAHFNLCAPAS